MPDLATQPGEPGFWQFDPSKVHVIFGGLALSGFAEGSFVEVDRHKDAWEYHVGTTGAVARVRTGDDTGMATFMLLEPSPCCQYLRALANNDQHDGLGVKTFLIRDDNDGMLAVATQSWLTRQPKVTRASSGGESVTFNLTLADLDVLVDPPENA